MSPHPHQSGWPCSSPEEGISPSLSPLVTGGAVTDIPYIGQGGNKAQGSLQEQLPPYSTRRGIAGHPIHTNVPLSGP